MGARESYGMNSKRKWILENDPTFETLPGAKEVLEIVPQNRWLCRGKDNSIVSYYRIGTAGNGTETIAATERLDAILYVMELRNMLEEIVNAVEGAASSRSHIMDFSDGALCPAWPCFPSPDSHHSPFRRPLPHRSIPTENVFRDRFHSCSTRGRGQSQCAWTRPWVCMQFLLDTLFSC